jgi:prevent-host-death family protein
VSTESVRALRADLATAVRRASHGERIVVTVGGRPTAQLGPLDDHAPDLQRLVASGAILPPRRTGLWRAPVPVSLWPGARVDQALRDVRG